MSQKKQRNCADHLFRILFRTDEYDGAVCRRSAFH